MQLGLCHRFPTLFAASNSPSAGGRKPLGLGLRWRLSILSRLTLLEAGSRPAQLKQDCLRRRRNPSMQTCSLHTCSTLLGSNARSAVVLQPLRIYIHTTSIKAAASSLAGTPASATALATRDARAGLTTAPTEVRAMSSFAWHGMANSTFFIFWACAVLK